MTTGNFPRTHIVAALSLSVVAGCIPALQPLLLGALLSEGRIAADQVGHAATAEGLGLALGSGLLGAWARPKRLRLIATIAVLAMVGANLITMGFPASGLVPARGVSGLGCGLLLWLFLSMLARSSDPARLFAIYVTSNACLVFLLSVLLGSFALARYGAFSGYAILAAAYGLLLVVAAFAADEYDEIGGGQGGVMPLVGVSALIVVLLFMAGVMAFWVYTVPLGGQAGIATGTVQKMVGASTGVQIAAGVSAIALANRLSGFQAVALTASGALAALALTLSNGLLSWIAALSVFSFCWMFAPAFFIPFVNLADPSRRAAVFAGTAQLLGYALGPLVASNLISSADYGAARSVSIICFAAVLVGALALRFRARASSAGTLPDGERGPRTGMK